MVRDEELDNLSAEFGWGLGWRDLSLSGIQDSSIEMCIYGCSERS